MSTYSQGTLRAWRWGVVSALVLVSSVPLLRPREARAQQSLEQFVDGYLRDERIGEALRNKRYSDALQLLKPAATAGDPKAQALYGAILTEFLGDHEGALSWLTRGKAGGELGAYYALAHMYKEGRGVERSAEKAHALMFTAAAEDFPGSQADLAGMYLLGEVTGLPSYAEGLYWAARASAGGDARGTKLVALVENELSKNCSQMRDAHMSPSVLERYCVDWTAAEYATPVRSEDCTASFLLQSLRTRFRLAKGAAEGWPECAYQVGMSNYVGGRQGLAHEWFVRAALKEHVPSQYMLASMYSSGKVQPDNPPRTRERAEFWWAAAARGGDERALKEVRERGIDVNLRTNAFSQSRLLELGYDIRGARARSGQASPAASASVIVGTWSQNVLVDGKYQMVGSFEVTEQRGQYRMRAVEQSTDPGIVRSVGIHSISFDGDTWQFTSEWEDGRRGTFYLTRVSDNRFEGFVWVGGTRTGPRNRWERMR